MACVCSPTVYVCAWNLGCFAARIVVNTRKIYSNHEGKVASFELAKFWGYVQMGVFLDINATILLLCTKLCLVATKKFKIVINTAI